MHDQLNLEHLAAALEASGDYKVLRRLVARVSIAPIDPTDKVGVILDLETTGLDWTKHEVIELGMVRFTYSALDEVTGVSGATKLSTNHRSRSHPRSAKSRASQTTWFAGSGSMRRLWKSSCATQTS
jgi:hypothetical protein